MGLGVPTLTETTLGIISDVPEENGLLSMSPGPPALASHRKLEVHDVIPHFMQAYAVLSDLRSIDESDLLKFHPCTPFVRPDWITLLRVLSLCQHFGAKPHRVGCWKFILHSEKFATGSRG